MSVLERFSDKSNLIAALAQQKVVGGDTEVAQLLAEEGELQLFGDGDIVIEQGDSNRDIMFILFGKATVIINGVRLYPRANGLTIGEMSAINPQILRSATLESDGSTVVWRVTSQRLEYIANKQPKLWKALAVEITTRLEQRNSLINRSNSKPKVFIVCSTEALKIAGAIRIGLDHTDAIVEIWDDDKIFESGSYPLEALEAKVNETDFAIALAEPDDIVRSRDRTSNVPRDNVIFELGFFMSRLGRGRTMLLVPRGADVTLPSDFKGMSPITYKQAASEADLPAAMGVAIERIEGIIRAKGPRRSLFEAK